MASTTRKSRKTVTVRAPKGATLTTTPGTIPAATVKRQRPRRVATAKQIQEALNDIRDEHLVCRDFGHQWRQYAVKKARGGFERSMFCRQCKTARHQFVSNKGEIISNSYSYVDGYQFRGLGRIVSEGKGLIRLETIERTLDGSHESMLEQPDGPIGRNRETDKVAVATTS